MCGRYALTADAAELLEVFDVPLPDFEVRPRFNIAPGQPAPVVAEDRRGRRIGLLTWGLVPAWQDEPRPGLINARSETVREKASFREAFERRRCLVPADGFYEWKREGEGKGPYWIHPTSGGLVSFAAVWERWSRPGSEARHTFAILTTSANMEVARVHDRMPVLIGKSDRDRWLDGATDAESALALLRGSSAPGLILHRVSTRVNRPQEDDASLVEPVP